MHRLLIECADVSCLQSPDSPRHFRAMRIRAMNFKSSAYNKRSLKLQKRCIWIWHRYSTAV